MSTLAAIEDAIRPVRAPRARRENPERAGAARSASTGRPLTSGGRPVRDNSRAMRVEQGEDGAYVVLMPTGRRPEEKIAKDAASLLADAQKAAPGAAIRILYRRRVLAEVSAVPTPSDGAIPLAAPAKGRSGPG